MWLIIRNTSEPTHNQVSIPLPEGDFRVGRGAKCDIAIGDKAISRCHVILTRSGNDVSFRDGGGSGNIEHNGSESLYGSLKEGDSLSIGNTTLMIQTEPPPPPQMPSIKTSISPTTSSPMPERASQVISLLGASQEKQGIQGLLDGLLRYLVELLGGERGFVLLRRRSGALHPVATHAIADAKTLLAISRTIYTRALEKGEVVVVTDTNEDTQLKQSLTFAVGGNSRTILCAPLLDGGTRLGVVYVDLPRKEEDISKERMELVETVVALAASRIASQEVRTSLLAAKGALVAAEERERTQEELVHGDGPAANALMEHLEAAAKSETTVLITGETGTGKEMVARALHRLSSRRDKPFIALNCAALPLDLIEAELFGVEKGAFSGAEERRAGRFECANGGTLFLDEVGELPLEMQVKLLRILQDRTVTRLGGNKSISLDFRLICATNRNLESAINEGSFRSDLYYRVNVYPIELLPLRKRPEDILPLATYFAGYFKKRYNKRSGTFSQAAEKLLQSFGWPGNVRQLRNVIERAVVLESNTELTPESFSFLENQPVQNASGVGLDFSTLPRDYTGARELFERAYLERGLKINNGNVSALIREAGVGRPTIYRWLKKYKINPKDL
mgnify:CR=1 FL=1